MEKILSFFTGKAVIRENGLSYSALADFRISGGELRLLRLRYGTQGNFNAENRHRFSPVIEILYCH